MIIGVEMKNGKLLKYVIKKSSSLMGIEQLFSDVSVCYTYLTKKPMSWGRLINKNIWNIKTHYILGL